ncbi:hypothetical protein GQ55_3G077900 [Panicum hallii var. hallii]|uniref:Uncharacterized protein n=1 Tax=Panicum hallii var. hallii TaxID=1504633 RepID=A0A2T7E6W5_9POAL|nr:hypothetical protein GQ55_3G077900 [Panicum hallii var. hallii]
MAASHAAIAIVTSLLLLGSSQSSLVHARMMPRDHSYVQHAMESSSSSSSSPSVSQDLLRVFTAPPTPPLVLTDKPEIATAKRRQIIQVVADGSVPSPGVGHHN